MVQHISKTSHLRLNPQPATTIEEFASARQQEVQQAVLQSINGMLHLATSEKLRQDEAEKNFVNNAQVKAHPLGAMYDDVIVHCMERTMATVKTSFPYLVSKGQGAVPRFVSQLAFEPFTLDQSLPFYLRNYFENEEDLEIRPLPVEHGADFMCAGFQFGRRDVVVYISDVSKIPQPTLEHLKTIPKIRLYVIDALRPVNYEKASRPMVHFDLVDALESIRQLGKPPVMTLLIGLGHEFDYESTNKILRTLPAEIYGHVGCSFDGLVLDLDL